MNTSPSNPTPTNTSAKEESPRDCPHLNTHIELTSVVCDSCIAVVGHTNTSLRDELIQLVGLEETLHGQLVVPTEDYNTDWTGVVDKLESLLTTKTTEAVKDLLKELHRETRVQTSLASWVTTKDIGYQMQQHTNALIEAKLQQLQYPTKETE